MDKITFSSRRQELTADQHTALAAMLDAQGFKIDHDDGKRAVVVVKAVQWQATSDAQSDFDANMAVWSALGPIAAGDFPHAALAALYGMRRLYDAARMTGFASDPPTPPAVFVRVYAIGGGFKRDTEFLRWARI
jgi:hypothetical protein